MTTAPAQVARMQFSTLAFNRAAIVNSAIVMNLQQGYQQALTAQQANAPALSTVVNGPGVYAGVDGKAYLVPSARLAYRANLPRTPDLSFTSDGSSWTITANIQLFRPPGSDAHAIPLLMDSYTVTIDSGDGTPGFTFKKVTPFSAPDGATDLTGILKAEGVIDETLALTLLRDKPNARITVTGSLSYRHQYTRVIQPPPPQPAPPHPAPVHPPAVPPGKVMGHVMFDRMVLAPQVAPMIMTVAPPHPTTQTVIDGITANQTLGSIACHFDPGLKDFKPIFAVIMGSASDGTVWLQQPGPGYSRPASGSNAYYILPDCYRLALDANSGLPAMSLLLVETPPSTPDGSTTFSLRVRLAVAPVLDGGRLEKMRESLRSSQNIMYAQLVIGGYTSATFVLSAMFSQLPGFHSSVLNADAGAGIDASNGFELVLDCSLEFYTLLTKMLTSPDGVQGTVQFKIVTSHVDSTPPVDTMLVVNVPVVLSFHGPSPLKIAAALDSTAPAAPNLLTVAVTNPLQSPLNVSGIYPTVMTVDQSLGVTTGATVLTPSQNDLALAPAEQKSLTLTNPGGGPLPSYTSLGIDFGSIIPTFDPTGVLNHYQSLVSTSGLKATAHFNCYLLKHPDQIPPALANLIGVQIEVKHTDDGPTLSVPLTRDSPALDAGIPYSFAEFLAGESLSEPTFKYRVKSVFTDHVGQFGDWIPQTGGIVEVTPV
jgi:hypothetical protein